MVSIAKDTKRYRDVSIAKYRDEVYNRYREWSIEHIYMQHLSIEDEDLGARSA